MALEQLEMTQDAGAAPAASDAALVEAARAGDREAFGRIVERHQALVCALTCGSAADPSRGKDLAQETFLEAWRSLASLRDAAKLRPWLCGIARNVALNARRQEAREATASLDDVPEPGAPDLGPAEHAVLAEERAMLARALEEVPEVYREALILFYWEDKSSARVAEAFGLTEDAARQRVARGRRMLRDHVVAVVEEGLRRARPGRAFKVAVLAALPAGAPEAAAAATSSVAATAAKAALGPGVSGALAGSLMGVAGAVLGAWASITNTRSPRERAFMIRMTWIAAGLCLGLLVVEAAAMFVLVRTAAGGPLSPGPVIGTILGLTVVSGGGVFWMVFRINRRQREIQIEDGTHVPPSPQSPRERRFVVVAALACLAYVVAFLMVEAAIDTYAPEFTDSAYWALSKWTLYGVGLLQLILWMNRRQGAIRAVEARTPAPPPQPDVRMPPGAIYGSHAGFLGGVLWMFPMCWLAGDWLVALLVLAASGSIYLVSVRLTLRRPERYFRIAFWEGLAFGALLLAVINLRWEPWMAAYRASRWYEPMADWPLWLVNVLVVVMIVEVQRKLLTQDRQQRAG